MPTSSLNVNAKAFEPRVPMSAPVDIPLPEDPWAQTEEVCIEGCLYLLRNGEFVSRRSVASRVLDRERYHGPSFKYSGYGRSFLRTVNSSLFRMSVENDLSDIFVRVFNILSFQSIVQQISTGLSPEDAAELDEVQGWLELMAELEQSESDHLIAMAMR